MRRRPSAALALAAVLIAAAPAGAQDSPAPRDLPVILPAAYLSALADYRSGDLIGAMNRLNAIGEGQIPEITRKLLRRELAPGTNWARIVEGAVALHTEVYFVRLEAGTSRFDDPYLASAHTLIRRIIQLAGDGEWGLGARDREFARIWYLLIVAAQHGEAAVGWSRGFLADAQKAFPGDAGVLLAAGADHEMISDVSAGLMNVRDSAGFIRRQMTIDAGDELADAIRLFKEAVAAAPGEPEPKLRLGRTLYRRGDLEGSARELDAALQIPSPDILKYLLLLFRGQVDAAMGQLAAAEQRYAQALRVMPRAQSAALAKSEALYLNGRVAEAASLVQAVLQQGQKEDPWWLYIQGEWWHFEARLDAMRRRVRD